MQKPLKLVIFDLDKTLINANISYRFGCFLYKKGYVRLLSCCLIALAYLFHVMWLLPLSWLHRFAFYFLFYKEPAGYYLSLAERFVKEEIEQMIHMPVYEELQAAKKRGDSIVVLSSSPYFLVATICRYLGIENCAATQYLTDEVGDFLSVGEVMSGKKKVEELQKLLPAVETFTKATYVVVYTDSLHDYALLCVADEPCIVSPGIFGRAIAFWKRWRIIS